jgi:hypothetical protein
LLAEQTAVVPAFLATAAFFERSHTVYVSAASGGFLLRLGHQSVRPELPGFHPGAQAQGPGHHHGLASKAICVLAGNPHPLGDHETWFDQGGTLDRTGGGVKCCLRHSSTPLSFWQVILPRDIALPSAPMPSPIRQGRAKLAQSNILLI